MQNIQQTIDDLIQKTQVNFGTSGARGLVTEMTDQVCYLYTQGFLQYLKTTSNDLQSKKVALSGDLRLSTPRILKAVAQAVQDNGYQPIFCQLIPTPALSLYGFHQKIPSIMVTGSHLEDDRNGIKFNRSKGELLKHEETFLKQQVLQYSSDLFDDYGKFKVAPSVQPQETNDALKLYKQRYLNTFGNKFLKGYRIGFYQHSAVGRFLIPNILHSLGATIISLGRSENFIPVDTEAVRKEDFQLAKKFVQEHQLHALFSTDGDSDRPLIFNEQGNWLRGDIAGILTSLFLKAQSVVTPVSSNTAVEQSQYFKKVIRTRIGSPYVIDAMSKIAKELTPTVGYEANGGFLIHQEITTLPLQTLQPLSTRDALIVFISLIGLAKEKNLTLSQLQKTLPARYTMSQRIENMTKTQSQKLLDWVIKHKNDAFFNFSGKLQSIDTIDGVRFLFKNKEIIHLRPSGNAPELRCYTEADNLSRSQKLNQACIQWIQQKQKDINK